MDFATWRCVKNVFLQFDKRVNSPILASGSLSGGWCTGVELAVASPLVKLGTWWRGGLQELEGTWPSAPLEAEQEPDRWPRSAPFMVLQEENDEWRSETIPPSSFFNVDLALKVDNSLYSSIKVIVNWYFNNKTPFFLFCIWNFVKSS